MKHRFTRRALMCVLALTLAAPFFPGSHSWANDDLTPAQKEAVRKAVEEYLRQQQGQAPPAVGAPPTAAPVTGGKRLEELATPRAAGQKYGSTMQGSGGLIFARPFVAAPKAIVGGYTDIEYFNRANDGKSSFFDQHRLVPFIYGDVSDHVKFAAEIEFEHFSRGKLEGGSSGAELGVEFMAIDYLVADPFNLRAGIILLPLGKFNLLHDAPLRDLTDRPIVVQRIIPTTLSQAGIGFYGTFYPTRLSKLDYEFYITNGFTGFKSGDSESPISGKDGLKDARKGGVNDNNDGKSFVGRVAFSPLLGIELGASAFYGSYDPQSRRALAIWALDGTFQRGPFELIGEGAWAYAKDNHLSLMGTPVFDGDGAFAKARRMNGYYIQLNYHFLPAFLTRLAPSHFRPEISTFTAVVRWEETDLNNEVDGNFTSAREFQRVTFGLNYRPTEDTVFKFDFQYSPQDIGNERGNDNVPVQNTAFIASWATYF
ncbi:MAG: hypothetical protein D6690_03055 [Nitrospirae bacterium]|nr:MAG: hypothetical protein D6690_03055 [Nitrospirota bacterium]